MASTETKLRDMFVGSTIVGSLPSAASVPVGSWAVVTDATLTPITGLGLAAVGSGANTAKVWSNGAAWLVG